MAKPMLITMPFLLLLLDYWPLHRFEKTNQGAPNVSRLLLEKLPMLAVAAGSAAATIIAQHDALSTVEKVS